MRNIRHAVIGAAVALLMASASGCNFITPPTGNPNAVPSAQLDQLFTTVQVNWFFMNESELGRMPAMWLQQMKGAQRQFSGYDVYIYGEDVGDDTWQYIYRHGGLLEIKEAIKLANDASRPAYAGILEVYEAYQIGTAADVWGNVPFSQAADPTVTEPQLDNQMDIYSAIQSLLDQAISDLGGSGAPGGGVDKVFNGDTGKWIKVAHSLKARYYMHTAEKNGDAAYASAMSEAQQGITSPSGNWKTIHSTASTEANDWWQFMSRDRTGYIAPNPYMIGLLKSRNDPRLDLYFTSFNADTTAADDLNKPGASNYDLPIVSCSETQFIIAEAAMHAGNTAAAQSAYEAGLACQDTYWGITLTPMNPVTMKEIMISKYIALFLNPEIWNDYKRTCYPQVVPPGSAITLAGHLQVPPGFYYPISERQTNPNIPTNDDNVLRHTNDPNYCQYPGVN
jgi:hypothetical protein